LINLASLLEGLKGDERLTDEVDGILDGWLVTAEQLV
jgi:hypothetical protein